jgi:hypothetical protein
MNFANRLLLISTIVFYNSFICSCASSSYFKTANDVNKIKGTVYMEDGTEKNGLITILFENGIDINSKVIHFISTGEIKEQTLKIESIKYYTIGGNSYYPKKIDLNFLGTNHLLFVKRVTEISSKIQMFELKQKFKSNNTGEEKSFYFISFPALPKYETIEINSNKLVPNFELKMKEFVTDCPDLKNKINKKQKGYSYSLLSFDSKKIAVLKKIIVEYNACK